MFVTPRPRRVGLYVPFVVASLLVAAIFGSGVVAPFATKPVAANSSPSDAEAYALDLINHYLDEKIHLLFGVVLNHLGEASGIRTTSELDEYFSKQAQLCTLSNIYEWLADKGIIQKVPSPLRLTHKSQVTVDEASYYYDPQTA